MDTLSSVTEWLTERHSCRAFLPDPIPQSTLETLIHAARRAPSSANLQPGKFHVLTGQVLTEFTTALKDIVCHETPEPPAYSYFPAPLSPEQKQRQRDAGYALYQALGITRRDIARRQAQFAANYRFFDAPVGIVVTLQKGMGSGLFMDLGMFMMQFLTAIQQAGYGSCVIGALSHYATSAQRLLAIPDEEFVVCGIAVGRPDATAPVNHFRTTRAETESYMAFHGFPDKQENP